jgi:hypothetical protein
VSGYKLTERTEKLLIDIFVPLFDTLSELEREFFKRHINIQTYLTRRKGVMTHTIKLIMDVAQTSVDSAVEIEQRHQAEVLDEMQKVFIDGLASFKDEVVKLVDPHVESSG